MEGWRTSLFAKWASELPSDQEQALARLNIAKMIADSLGVEDLELKIKFL